MKTATSLDGNDRWKIVWWWQEQKIFWVTFLVTALDLLGRKKMLTKKTSPREESQEAMENERQQRGPGSGSSNGEKGRGWVNSLTSYFQYHDSSKPRTLFRSYLHYFSFLLCFASLWMIMCHTNTCNLQEWKWGKNRGCLIFHQL